jgi:ferredoxin
MRCDGHGMCADACPEVFEIGDDEDIVTVLDNEPADELREKVNKAVWMCPKAAITVRD